MQLQTSGAPEWFYQSARELVLVGADPAMGTVMIGEGRSWVKIDRVSPCEVPSMRARWRIDWAVWHERRLCHVGRREMSGEELAHAFALNERDFDAERIEKAFKRWRNYLVIPGDSVGGEIKSRVAILLSDGIQNALRDVMSV